MRKILQPPGWATPKGYSNGIAVQGGTTVFVAGQVAYDAENAIREAGFGGQFRQALKNTLAVLAEAGAGPEHVVRMTWYISDKREYLGALKEVGAAWRELMGRNYPTMTVAQVVALVDDAAKVEIETTAVVP
ncbi:MAG: RidA family protein [Burkholderiales bacterium]|nr:RidA family protein [Burkholderiales bacterium]